MRPKRTQLDNLTPTLKAIGELFEGGFAQLSHMSSIEGTLAHSEIEQRPAEQKASVFFRHFSPLRKEMIKLLTQSYRRCFKLALAHVPGDACIFSISQRF
jgi:hypothetical protein